MSGRGKRVEGAAFEAKVHRDMYLVSGEKKNLSTFSWCKVDVCSMMFYSRQ